ncbi:MAG: hypothetical protein ACLQGP_14730 [Isosphaeraceae bacterium]
MTKALLPQAFWFRIAAPSSRLDEIPRSDDRKKLLDLPPACALPDGARFEGRSSWAEVRLAWNPRGLGIAVIADGIADIQLSPDRPEGFADVQFWVDTRDTRDVSRATRFCHRFTAPLRVRGIGRKLEVEVVQRPIARAVADAPISRSDLIASRAEFTRSGWTLEVFLPAPILNGFDPETNRRLGFAYQVADHVRDDQFLGVGRDFPIGENPGLWSTIELKD